MTHANVVDTPLVGRREEGLAAVSLQYIFTIFVARVSGHWLFGSQRVDSGFPLKEYYIIKYCFLPALASKCAAPFCYLSSPIYRRVTDGTVVKKLTILVEHRFAILS